MDAYLADNNKIAFYRATIFEVVSVPAKTIGICQFVLHQPSQD